MKNELHQLASLQCCPYVEDGNHACSSRFTLGRLDQACSVCFGTYQTCAMYLQISGVTTAPPLDMMINDRTIELRPTGS